MTDITNLPPSVLETAADGLLAVKTPHLIYHLPAIKKRLPAHGGTTLRMTRFARLPTFHTPLSEEGDPNNIPPVDLKKTDIDAKVQWYGQWMAITVEALLQNQHAVLSEATELMGLSLRETEDYLTKQMLLSSATYITCEGGSNGNIPTNLSPYDLDNATSVLLSNDAWMITDSIIGEDRFGTAPVRSAYVGMCHTNLTRDLNTLPGFDSKWNYSSGADQALSSEWGAFNNVRFFVSSVGAVKPQASIDGSDVYVISICGMEAYGIIDQDNYSSNFIYRSRHITGPLGLTVTAGVAFAGAYRLLNDLWAVNLACTLS